MPNPPLTQLAYDLLGENNYAVYFPEGSPEPSDQQLADAVRTVLREDCPAIATRVQAGGSRKNKRKNRKTRKH
jgi:hypothetical protein